MIFASDNTVLIKVRIILNRILDDAILFDDLIDRMLNLSEILLLCLLFDVRQTIEVDRNDSMYLARVLVLLLRLLN